MPLLLPCGATIAEPGDQPGDLLTGPRQIEFNGLLLGSGTPYRWKGLTNWDGAPTVDLADTPKPSDHGETPGPGFFQAKFPSFEFFVEATTREHMEQLLHLLEERMLYDDVEQLLVVRDTARTLSAPARVLENPIPHTPARSVGRLDLAVLWKCAAGLRTPLAGRTPLVLTPHESSGGLVYPVEYPVDWGIVADTSDGVAVNDGRAPAPARVVFQGPADAYTLLLTTSTGTVLKLAFTLPLTATDTLTVDTGDGTVRLNGSSDRTQWLTPDSVAPEQWRIPPGTSAVGYTVTAGSGVGTQVSIDWSDTYR